MADTPPPPAAPAAPPDALQAARDRGLPAADPARWRRIEALARRAASHTGATRQLLDARLQALLAAPASTTRAPHPPRPSAAHPGPLGSLLAALQGPASGPPGQPGEQGGQPPGELKVVQQHRAAWAQLRADQRVAQTQRALPDQAGPLNSQRLLHRALAQMRETSPAYLQHLMAQAEALMWLERAAAAPAAEARSAPARAPARGRTASRPRRG
jgi:hypothetical protein